MIIDGTRLVVTDNSGAKEVECIKHKGRFASIGDIITCSVKKGTRTGKVTPGQVVKAVVVETKKELRRADGRTAFGRASQASMRKLGDRMSMIALLAISAGTLYGLTMVSAMRKKGLGPAPQQRPDWWPGSAPRSRDMRRDENIDAALASLNRK